VQAARVLGVVVALGAVFAVGSARADAQVEPCGSDPDSQSCVDLDPGSGPPGTDVAVTASAGTCVNGFDPQSSASATVFFHPNGIDASDEPTQPRLEVGVFPSGTVFEATYRIPDDVEPRTAWFEVVCEFDDEGSGGQSFQITGAGGTDPAVSRCGDSPDSGSCVEADPASGPPGTEVEVLATAGSCEGQTATVVYAPGGATQGSGGSIAVPIGDTVEVGSLAVGDVFTDRFVIPEGDADPAAFLVACSDGQYDARAAFSLFAPSSFDPSVDPTALPRFDVPHDRSSFPASVPAIDDVSTDGELLLTNLAVAVLMLLLVFPAELFNATLEEHYDEVTRWLAGPRRLLERVNGWLAQRGAQVGFAIVTAATAVLYAFLDPNVSVDAATIALVVGIGGAIAVGVLVGGWGSRRYLAERHGDRGALKVYPAALIVAVVCVVISRVAEFQPGYLYGIVAAFAFTAQLSRDDEGKASAFAAVAGLAASIVAWLVWIPIRDSAADPDPNIIVLVLDAFLAAMFVAGLQALVFGFVPIRFLPGAKVWAWSKKIWALLFAIGCFGFLHTLVNASDEEGYEGNLGTMIGLFVAFGLASGAFWAYFRYRKPKPDTTEPGEEHAPADAVT
jgi:hypothetical protein